MQIGYVGTSATLIHHWGSEFSKATGLVIYLGLRFPFHLDCFSCTWAAPQLDVMRPEADEEYFRDSSLGLGHALCMAGGQCRCLDYPVLHMAQGVDTVVRSQVDLEMSWSPHGHTVLSYQLPEAAVNPRVHWGWKQGLHWIELEICVFVLLAFWQRYWTSLQDFCCATSQLASAFGQLWHKSRQLYLWRPFAWPTVRAMIKNLSTNLSNQRAKRKAEHRRQKEKSAAISSWCPVIQWSFDTSGSPQGVETPVSWLELLVRAHEPTSISPRSLVLWELPLT